MEAWYGVGLNAAGNWGMGMADYMVTMHNQNYTGVKDMCVRAHGHTCASLGARTARCPLRRRSDRAVVGGMRPRSRAPAQVPL